MSEFTLSSWASLVARHLPVALLTVDQQGRIVKAVANYWLRIDLFKRGDLEGRTLSEALPLEGDHQSWAFLDLVPGGGEESRTDLQTAGRTLDAFAARPNSEPHAPNSDSLCQLLLWDRTEELAALAQESSSHEIFEQITADLPAMLFQTKNNFEGNEMTVPYVSNRFEKLAGLAPQEVYDNPNLILNTIHVDDRPTYYDRAFKSINQVSLFKIDMRMVSTDGTATNVRVLSYPRRLADNSILFSGVAVEIDDLVQQIESLQASCEEMGRNFHERWQVLSDTKRNLEQEVRQRERATQELLDGQRALRKMLDVQDQQRLLLSYDLHDGFVQDVVGAKMLLEGYMATNHTESADLELVLSSLEHSMEEARRMINELRPMSVDNQGLAQAIESLSDYVQLSGVDVKVDHNLRDGELPPELASHAFRMIQESLSNVRKHAQSNQASVTVIHRKSDLLIEVEDHGIGFDPAEVSGPHFGLEGIQQRARILGGTAEFISQPGKGTRVSIQLPI